MQVPAKSGPCLTVSAKVLSVLIKPFRPQCLILRPKVLAVAGLELLVVVLLTALTLTGGGVMAGVMGSIGFGLVGTGLFELVGLGVTLF